MGRFTVSHCVKARRALISRPQRAKTIRHSIWGNASTWTPVPQHLFNSDPFFHSSVHFPVPVIQLWWHLGDSCQDKLWSGFQMPEYFGVSREKCTWLSSIWFDVFASTVPHREADDSNAIRIKQTPNPVTVFFFLIHVFVYADGKRMKESARGRTEKWRDQVSTRLNPLWLRSSILYRLNGTAATPFSSSLLSFLSCGSDCETWYQAEWFQYVPIWADCRGFHFPPFFHSPLLYRWEGIPLILRLN